MLRLDANLWKLFEGDLGPFYSRSLDPWVSCDFSPLLMGNIPTLRDLDYHPRALALYDADPLFADRRFLVFGYGDL